MCKSNDAADDKVGEIKKRRCDTYGDRLAIDVYIELIAQSLRCSEAYVQVQRQKDDARGELR